MRRLAPAEGVFAAEADGLVTVAHLGKDLYFRLNETATLIWRMMVEQQLTPTEMVEKAREQWGLSYDIALQDIDDLIAELLAAGILRWVDKR